MLVKNSHLESNREFVVSLFAECMIDLSHLKCSFESPCDIFICFDLTEQHLSQTVSLCLRNWAILC